LKLAAKERRRLRSGAEDGVEDLVEEVKLEVDDVAQDREWEHDDLVDAVHNALHHINIDISKAEPEFKSTTNGKGIPGKCRTQSPNRTNPRAWCL
jgi:vacuolar-type H+-ATPase subunit E/Vma4